MATQDATTPTGFDEAAFTAEIAEKDEDELLSLVEYYFDQHASIREATRAGPSHTQTVWDDQMKRLLRKIRLIEMALAEREEVA